MSLDAYANLKLEIADWLPRAGVATQIDTFIDLFEAWANRNLRMPQQESEANAAAAEYMSLPADFLELRDIQYQSSPSSQLQYVTPEFADLYSPTGAAGVPLFYTLVGNQIRLVPPPDATTNVRISYWQKITALDGSNTTNWLLTAYPDAYLYGSLMHARAYLGSPDLAQVVKDGWGQVMDEIQRAGKRRNLGGSLRIRHA